MISANLAALLYLVAGILFILALRGLSSPATSRRGNTLGMIGMAIAILTTLAVTGPSDWLSWLLIVAGIAIGGLIGAFAGGPGILILAGTGSMAWARNAAGASFRTGGWGEVIGDEGSGFWIGKRVLEAVSQSLDGRAGPTALIDAVFAQLALSTSDRIGGLEGWAASLANPRSAIAALAPLATQHAAEGDAAARAIIQAAAGELARHVETLERKLGDPALSWSYAGGMFASPVLRNAVTARIGRAPQAPLLPPIGGALLAAAQHLGWQPDLGWIAHLARSLAPLPARTERKPIQEEEGI